MLGQKKIVLFIYSVFPICRSGSLGFPAWSDPSGPGLGPEQFDWQVRLTSSVEVGPWRLITITQHGTGGMKPSVTTPLMGRPNTSRAPLCLFSTFFPLVYLSSLSFYVAHFFSLLVQLNKISLQVIDLRSEHTDMRQNTSHHMSNRCRKLI